MYIAEIKGKLPLSARKSEDVLTSNVFSFFNYAKRTVYLKELIDRLNISVSDTNLNRAEFIFWPIYEDGTQPDLVIIVGKYYILFEAKYHSGFSKQSATSESQLKREITIGQMEAENLDRIFILVAITADHCYKPEKFKEIKDYKVEFKWMNWQMVAEILLGLFEKNYNLPNKLFTSDLLKLLEYKKLRPFRSFNDLFFSEVKAVKESIFLIPETLIHWGKFIGFQKALSKLSTISDVGEIIFYKTSNR